MSIFRYSIVSASTELTYIDAPDGWKDNESIFPRSNTYAGVFRKYSAKKLTFKTTGAAILKEINATQGFESEAEYIVEQHNLDTYEWVEVFRGSLDFMEFETIEGNDGNSVEINVIDSSFWNIVKNRENDKLQLSRLVSLKDNFELAGYANEEQFATLPETPDTLVSKVATETNTGVLFFGNHSMPLTVTAKEDEGVKDVTDPETIHDLNNAFYQVKLVVTKLHFNVKIDTLFAITGDDQSFAVKLKQYRSASLYSSVVLGTYAGNTGDFKTIIINANQFYTDMVLDDYFVLSVETSSANEDFESRTPYVAGIDIVTTEQSAPKIVISGRLVHEALARSLQITSGVNNPLISNILGRKNSEPRSYAEDGEMSNIFITNGERIRGFTMDESPLVHSFKDLYQSLNSLRPLCAVIEKIDGADTLRVEARKYAYDNRIVITTDNASNVKKSYIEKSIYGNLEMGYNGAEYEDKKGIFEPNQKTEYSTPISVTTGKLSAISKINSDTNSIINARRKSKANFPTEDTRYDKKNFFIVVLFGDSLLLNGDFESWIDDNTPDDWNILAGATVSRLYLLGSNRIRLDSGPFGTTQITQDVIAPLAQKINFKLSYESTDIGWLGGNQAGYHIKLSNTVSGKTFYIDGNGSWTETLLYNWYAVNLIQKDVNEIQSMISFSTLFDEVPESGTITVTLFGTPGIILDDVYIGDSQYLAKTNEGYDVITNAPYGDATLNLDITPARNVLQHGAEIRQGLENKTGQYLTFNNSTKNSTLITQKTGEEPVIEDADILINTLAQPYLTPVKVTLDMPIGLNEKKILNDVFPGETKPKYLGIIEYRKSESENYSYIWILDVKTGGESGIGKVTGVEVNTDYIQPV